MAKSRIKKNTRIRQREKARRRKRERAKRVLRGVGKLSLSFLMVAGLALAGKRVEDFLLTSPHFQISEVDFKGLNFLEKETVESLAKIELGENIFQVDLGEIRKRLQSHPQVRKVIVSRQFPRGIEVKIKEREAIALIKNDGKIYPVDREGFIVPEGSLSRPLPLITGLGRKEMKVGKRIGGARLVKALNILETFSSSYLSISRIDLEERSPVVWMGKVKIFLRKEESGEGGLKELESILNDLKRRKERAEYIDLRFSNPVVKLQ